MTTTPQSLAPWTVLQLIPAPSGRHDGGPAPLRITRALTVQEAAQATTPTAPRARRPFGDYVVIGYGLIAFQDPQPSTRVVALVRQKRGITVEPLDVVLARLREQHPEKDLRAHMPAPEDEGWEHR